MTTSAPTGWLFSGVHLAGARSEASAPEGIALTPAGRVALVSGDAAIRQSIMLLLTTIPGERVMRPDYGCPLHRLVFSPNDATTAGLAIHYVRQALIRFEPRVEIVALDATGAQVVEQHAEDDEPAQPNKLVISLSYKVKATNRLGSLQLELGLDGGG